ncbi:MAG: glycosyltransferase family 4 protein [Prevotellaceae bacterium]|jgi:glycosyltransferase involved in cell wall biosynthesis|nr:glycosyltransferase family 4 protein [Prevotellaceae bacterium]
MIIGYDAKRAFKNFTGLGNYSRSVISTLAEYYPDNRYILYTPPYRNHTEHAFAQKENVKIIKPHGLYKKFSSVWRSFGISKYAEQDKVKLFHGLSGELPTGLSQRNIRSVVTIHDLIFLRYPEFYKPIDRSIYKKKFRAACKNSDLIIAISKQTKDDIVNFFKIKEEKIRLVYQGCNPQFYNTCSEEQKQVAAKKYNLPQKYILYVGTIEERKNLNTIIRALASMPKDIYLVAIGRETKYTDKVTAEINKLKLNDRVKFIHKSDFRDLPAIYQQAQVFVLPSVFEGFGIPVLEALNSKIPVIASNVSSLPEAGGPHSLYINPTDSKELEKALFQLFAHPELRENMIVNGYKYAQNFREQKLANDLWSVYQELM